MRTTIDGAGRVVIPKPIRDNLGLHGGEELDVRERDGHIEIDIAPTPVRLVKKGRGLVAVPDRELPVLTDDIVQSTLDRVRR